MSTTASRLFIGNLPYETKEEDIQELLKDQSIKSIKIPVRRFKGELTGKGFAFVEFAPEANVDLDELIKKFEDFEFNGRKIYLAHPTPPKAETESSEDSPEEANSEKPNPKKTRNSRKPKAIKNPESATTEATTETISSNPSSVRAPKNKVDKLPIEEGSKSKNTLFVRNIPVDTDYAEIQEFLKSKDETIQYISLPYRRLRREIVNKLKEEGKEVPKKNKGFLFIRFESKDNGESIEEKSAKFQGLEFQGKELQVEVAIDTLKPAKAEAEEAPVEEKTEA